MPILDVGISTYFSIKELNYGDHSDLDAVPHSVNVWHSYIFNFIGRPLISGSPDAKTIEDQGSGLAFYPLPLSVSFRKDHEDQNLLPYILGRNYCWAIYGILGLNIFLFDPKRSVKLFFARPFGLIFAGLYWSSCNRC